LRSNPSLIRNIVSAETADIGFVGGRALVVASAERDPWAQQASAFVLAVFLAVLPDKFPAPDFRLAPVNAVVMAMEAMIGAVATTLMA
jgi:hypothetical protein